MNRNILSRSWSSYSSGSQTVNGDLYSVSAGTFETASNLTPGPIFRNSFSRYRYTKGSSVGSSTISQCIAIDTSEFRGMGNDDVQIYDSSANVVSFVPGDRIVWHNIQLGTGAYTTTNGDLYNIQISKNTNELVDIEETFEWEVKPYTYSYFRIIPLNNDSGAYQYTANPALTGMFTDQTTYSIYRES